MKRTLLFALLLASFASAQQPNIPRRPVSTFSIVARDAKTGEIGVAVQSHWFSVGAVVPWAEAGVGAVATQSFVDPSYGKLGLDLMRAGESAPEALKALLAGDEGRDVRQVAMVDANGKVAVWTGGKAIASAGHCAGQISVTIVSHVPGRTEEFVDTCISEKTSFNVKDYPKGQLVATHGGYSVQANLMANEKVWPAMAKAFEKIEGDLATRMLAALDAAQAAGGDIRGKQSAALIVVKAKSSGKPWQDRVFDLRVEDHTEPLKELRRLVTIGRAYNHMNAGDYAIEKNDFASALREYGTAEKLIDGVSGIEPSRLAEMIFWHAVAMVSMKKVDEAMPLFKRAFSIEPSWRETTPRLVKAGLLPDDAALIKRIVGQ